MMQSNKLTKSAFIFADIISWVFVIGCIISVAFTFSEPHISAWSKKIPPPVYIEVLESINNLFHGLGFFLLIKRKIIGFLFIVMTSLASLAVTTNIYVLYYLLIVVAILGFPWFLSYKEIERAQGNET